VAPSVPGHDPASSPIVVARPVRATAHGNRSVNGKFGKQDLGADVPSTGQPPPRPRPRESNLYAPVKHHLEALGYTVRGEVGRCDVLGVSGDMMVAVELKLAYGLPVLYQALRRLPSVDLVYVAVGVPEGRIARGNWDAQVPDAVRLCRMLGVGLLSVRNGNVVVHTDPTPYQPRKQPKQRARLLSEFVRRSGDHNLGGTNRRPRMTAYREDALACAQVLAVTGALRAAAVRAAAGVAKANAILGDNVYGWFEKVARGTYNLTPAGRVALAVYADVVAARVCQTRA
jgi:hypothetical protein